MKIPDSTSLRIPEHHFLRSKDEREWYGTDPHDYYAVQYRQRINRICREVLRLGGKRVLELGCAQSTMALNLAETGVETTGTDINFAFLTYSRLKHEHGTIRWVQASADALPFRAGSFDTIILGELLEHCAYPERILAACRDILAPGGSVIVTTPNNGSTENHQPTFSAVKHDREAIARFQFGPDGDDHLFTFTFGELSAMLSECGFSSVRGSTMGHHALQWKHLFHLRRAAPFIWNSVLESVIPRLPILRRRITRCLFFTATRRRADG